MPKSIEAANGRMIAPANKWFSIPDLAGLPGVPKTERGTHGRAEAEGWRSRVRSVGKGREYRRIDLPTETQSYLDSLSEIVNRREANLTRGTENAHCELKVEWLNLDRAISDMLCAKLSDIPEVASRLERARKSFRAHLAITDEGLAGGDTKPFGD